MGPLPAFGRMRGAAVVAAALIAPGCFSNDASGVVALRDYPVAATSFSEVVLNGEGEVSIVPGDYALSVSAEEDVLPSVRVERDGAALVLGRNVDWFDGVRATVPVRFRVTLPRLEAMSVAGPGTLTARGFKTPGELQASAAGAGRIALADTEAGRLLVTADGASSVVADAVAADAMRFRLRGSARIVAAGVTPEAEVDISGAGLFRGSHLRTQQAVVVVTGAGQAFIWAEQELTADVAGVGRVHYRGAPRIAEALQREGRLLALDPPPA